MSGHLGKACCSQNRGAEFSPSAKAVGRPYELLRVQTALIEIEKTGMTCPVDWQLGGELLDYPSDELARKNQDWLKESVRNFNVKSF